VISLTKSCGLEFARQDPRQHRLPSNVRTPMLEGFTGGDEQALLGMGKMTPIGRWAPRRRSPRDRVAVQRRRPYVTSHAFAVDGGHQPLTATDARCRPDRIG
jgi:hypothetical protein